MNYKIHKKELVEREQELINSLDDIGEVIKVAPDNCNMEYAEQSSLLSELREVRNEIKHLQDTKRGAL